MNDSLEGWGMEYAARQCELAKTIALVAHADHWRAGSPREHYTEHLRRVAANFPPGPRLCTAWLHDTIEDTPVTEALLRELGVNAYVVDAVLLLTHEQIITMDEYHDHVVAMAERTDFEGRIAQAVKLADLRDNLGAIERLQHSGLTRTADMLAQRYADALQLLGGF